MEIQVECTEKNEEYNIVKIAEGMKLAEEITIEKYYNKETASIKDGVTENLTDLEGIVVSVDEYSEYKFLIGEKCEIEGVLEGEVSDTTNIGEFTNVEEFETKAFGSKVVTDNIEFSYEKKRIASNKMQLLIIVKEEENGLNKIEYPYGDVLNCNGKNQIAIDYVIEYGVEYVFKITSNNGYVKEVTIKENSLVLLEHFDNNNGVIINSDRITTEEKKVGNSSLYLNDTHIDDYYTKQFGFSDDFTIEYWIKAGRENLNYEWAIHLAVYANNGIFLGFSNGKYIVRGWDVQTYLTLEPPPMEEWVHIAVTRKSGVLKVFYNGILQDSVQNTTNFANGKLCIGYEGTNANCKNSYIDELKISPNISKYENNFNTQDSITYPDDIVYHFENDDRLYNSYARQSIEEKKFGQSSYYFNNSYLTYKDKEEFQLLGDFTIDYWIKQNSENLNSQYSPHLAVTNHNGIYLGLIGGKYAVRGLNV